ncbi:MAG: hypothetical protein R3327_03135 [Nitrosopumilaceae archaeon]|nr:hypothetical protein [Nitrosopumilaceae archaeon]
MRLAYVAIVLLFSISFVTLSYAETWNVEIPTGSSYMGSNTHYTPEEISVNVLDTVIWTNGDSTFHTVTSGSLQDGRDDRFDSKYIPPTGTFSYQFLEKDVGEVKYFCTIHPWLYGLVNVIEIREGFDVYHNLGYQILEVPFDIQYKLKRNLVDVVIETERNSLTFLTSGKIDNDTFEIILPTELIQNPNSVWLDKKQIVNFEKIPGDGFTHLKIPLEGHTENIIVVGSEVAGEFTPPTYTLINQIVAVSDKQKYFLDESLIISGDVINRVSLAYIEISITEPSSVVVYHDTIDITKDSKFSQSIPLDSFARKSGIYLVEITGKDAKSSKFEIVYDPTAKVPKSPLKQIQDNINPENIVCKSGMTLLKKISNDMPVCVKLSSVDKITSRGFAAPF